MFNRETTIKSERRQVFSERTRKLRLYTSVRVSPFKRLWLLSAHGENTQNYRQGSELLPSLQATLLL